MTIDSIMNNSSDRRTRKCDGEDGAADCWMFKRVNLSLGSVSGWAGLRKGVSPERDRPSQMNHAELKNCCFLFRVSFHPSASIRRQTVAATPRPACSVCLDKTTKIYNRSHVALICRCLGGCGCR